ncbi:phosphatidylglycerophosphatase A family protein [Dysgonomonas reticulitermitis]
MERKMLFHKIIATGFGSGYFPVAPGTAGAALATIIWYVISVFVSPCILIITTAGLIALFTIAGIWSANKLEPVWGEDPSRIVVDEMVGVWIPLLAAIPDKFYYPLAAFILFRFFDIYKPLGIRRMESLKGGLGVMMDDILAGAYSFLLLLGLRWLIG